MTNDTIGVDVSKDHLDAHRMSSGANRRFANDKAGYTAFVAWAAGPDVRVVYEPTGAYHKGFERKLAEAGFALVKVNPRQARRFAEATGKLAKTDRLDAAMLAKMGALLDRLARARPGPRKPVPHDVQVEATIAERVLSDLAAVNLLGDQVPYNCPNCGGVLWEVEKSKTRRYRCHTGHSYTAAALLEEQSGKIEETLWITLRMLEERRNLLRAQALPANGRRRAREVGIESRARSRTIES